MSQETSSPETLSGFVALAAGEFGVRGVAAGVWADGQEAYAFHGVTSVENPLPVDPDTVFVLGSVAKTFTATAVMRLVADGKVELDAPVRRYVPEFTLKDEQAAAAITVLNLLNHTAGLDWRMSAETGEGDAWTNARAAQPGRAVWRGGRPVMPGRGLAVPIVAGDASRRASAFEFDLVAELPLATPPGCGWQSGPLRSRTHL